MYISLYTDACKMLKYFINVLLLVPGFVCLSYACRKSHIKYRGIPPEALTWPYKLIGAFWGKHWLTIAGFVKYDSQCVLLLRWNHRTLRSALSTAAYIYVVRDSSFALLWQMDGYFTEIFHLCNSIQMLFVYSRSSMYGGDVHSWLFYQAMTPNV